jgi:hypothetical protein
MAKAHSRNKCRCAVCGKLIYRCSTHINRVAAPCCSRSCRDENQRMTVRERFLSAPKTRSVDGCLLWGGATGKGGYGVLIRTSRRRMYFAHRVSWEVHFGPIPSGMLVCHRCDNPRCVDPNHLFLGTNDDNMADMVEKGRQCRGSDCHTSRLSVKDVLEIRALHATGEHSQGSLARRFGVWYNTIHMIVTRKSWRHV